MPYLNINLDDVHPETNEFIADCGGDLEKGPLKYVRRLIDEFPKIKITLFVTPNWVDKPNDPLLIKLVKKALGIKYTNKWDNEPFRLDKHKKWCEQLNKFVRKGNIEIAIHGLYHHRNSDPHSAEFMNLHYEECKSRLIVAEEIFKQAGLEYVKGFRPPGWGISDGLFRALKELGYLYISLDPWACRIPEMTLSRYKVVVYKGLINIPQNWDIKRGTVSEALEILERHGLLSAKGHIQDRYGRDYLGNGLTEESYRNIRSLLLEIEKEGIDVEFVTMEEIAKRFKKSL